ncbi:MAG: NUDIX hydrolase [Pseudarcicella sp.]|nr:NUDIX hydrolase [Pseudarcicella sp.]
MRVRPSAAIISEKKILLMRYLYGSTDVYNLPGGNTDPAETLHDTLHRELKEELGIKIAIEQMLLAGEVVFPEKKSSALHVVFLSKITEGTPVLNPEETTALGLEWVSLDKLNTINMYPNVGIQILNSININNHNSYIGKINQTWF